MGRQNWCSGLTWRWVFLLVKTLEMFCLNPESKVKRDIVSRSQVLLNHCNSCSYKKNIWLYSLCHGAIEDKIKWYLVRFDLIASLIDIISNARVNIYILFGEWYKDDLKILQKVIVNKTKPRVCYKQTDRENRNVNSIAGYYRFTLVIPLIDIIFSELKREFWGEPIFHF